VADFRIEAEVLRDGFSYIAGLDEAGRGALFGPVVAAAVIFPTTFIRDRGPEWLKEIDDSKRLSPRKRKRLAAEIVGGARAIGVGLASHSEIDRENIYRASLSAMSRAARNLMPSPDFLLVDGFQLNDVNYSQRRIVKGDQKSTTIAAASIIAKVCRDEMMVQFNSLFQEYALARNKGYGTRSHYEALRRLGPTPFHRRTFHLGVNQTK